MCSHCWWENPRTRLREFHSMRIIRKSTLKPPTPSAQKIWHAKIIYHAAGALRAGVMRFFRQGDPLESALNCIRCTHARACIDTCSVVEHHHHLNAKWRREREREVFRQIGRRRFITFARLQYKNSVCLREKNVGAEEGASLERTVISRRTLLRAAADGDYLCVASFLLHHQQP